LLEAKKPIWILLLQLQLMNRQYIYFCMQACCMIINICCCSSWTALYALLLFMLCISSSCKQKTCCPDALFPLQKTHWLIAFFVCFFSCHGSNTALFDNQNRKLGFAKLVVHATDLLTDGGGRFVLVQSWWGSLGRGPTTRDFCMPQKGGGQKWWLFENRTRIIDQNQLFESFENHGYTSESVLWLWIFFFAIERTKTCTYLIFEILIKLNYFYFKKKQEVVVIEKIKYPPNNW
jgi:hypothetical protein